MITNKNDTISALMIDNKGFFPSTKGMTLMTAEINAQGQIESYTRLIVKDVSEDGVTYETEVSALDEMPMAGKAVVTQTMKVENGNVEVDVGAMLSKMVPGIVDIKSIGTVGKMFVPAKMSLDEKFGDLDMKMSMSIDLAAMMKSMGLVGELPDGMPDKIQSSVAVAVRDYKCVAVEDVKVLAGTFEKSYKVSYRGEVTINIGGETQTTIFTNVTWNVRGIGTVKTIFYDSNGETLSISELVNVLEEKNGKATTDMEQSPNKANMGNIGTLNCSCALRTSSTINGMIDAHAYYSHTATWPIPLQYVWIDCTENGAVEVHFTDRSALKTVDRKNIGQFSTITLGEFLVGINSRMYNEENINNPDFMKNCYELSKINDEIKKLMNDRKREDIRNEKERERLEDLEKEEKTVKKTMTDVDRKSIPSLIIAPTMDMEFAHIGGYDGETIYQQDMETGKIFYKKYGQPVYLDDDTVLMFKDWRRQISDVEAAVASNPLRLFPLFSYDPRRYRLPNEKTPGDKGCAAWDKPFAHIVGCEDSISGINKVWLGFCMNPFLGFRPFDEYCEHLPRFYKKCVDGDIPILANCVPGGFIAHDVDCYQDELDERIDKCKERHEIILKEGLSSCQNKALSSYTYYSKEHVVDDKYESLNHFYMNYGHPRNWIPVLEYFPSLRVCLSGFGGNSEWLRAGWIGSGASLPTRLWPRCIIKLAAKYENVYADLSGLNIYDDKIRGGLLEMLRLIQDDKNEEFKHMKDKLIFGSGWYLTCLTDVSTGGIDGGVSVSHSYSNYCREFKKLVSMADIKGKGTLWERVSLINPWRFYGLDSKIGKIRDELVKNTDRNIDIKMLEKMKNVFDGSDNVVGLVDYIKKVG